MDARQDPRLPYRRPGRRNAALGPVGRLAHMAKRPAPQRGTGPNSLAGYVRVSANTYAYGLRRGFALLVTGVTL